MFMNCFMNLFEERLEMNRKAFDAVKNNCTENMSEKDIKAIILKAWNKPDMEFSGDVCADGRIDGDATDYLIVKGNTLILDLQPGDDGCFADTTRTFFAGEPTSEQKHAYKAVLYALKRMECILATHPKSNEVYNIMQEALGEYGYSCPHHAGHALGKEKYMEPALVYECDSQLEEGMIIALEPGVYMDGWGIRLENNYLLTADGIKELFNYPLEIENFII